MAPKQPRADALLWNYASLVVLGLSGVALNTVISRAYSPAALGSFNQVLAAYIVFSMLASAGLHFSVLRAIAEDDTPSRRIAVLAGALGPALGLALLGAAAFYLARAPIAGILGSEAVAAGIEAATPGLFFFALNKLGLAVVNGLLRMRAFAVYQSLRYVFLIGALVAAPSLGVPGERLPIIFTLSEGLLFLILAIEVSSQLAWWRGFSAGRAWARTHLVYGVKALGSGVLVELNARVDVLMLGYFLADGPVGIYSFAGLFAEGFFQIMVVLQNNYNPIMARELAVGRTAELATLIRSARRWIVPLSALAGGLGILLYPFVLALLTGSEAYAESARPFAVLAIGIVLASAHLPFLNALSMANRPGWHTWLMAFVVGVNVVGNALLIPRFGIDGAAAASALAFVASALALSFACRRLLGLRI